jgi:hypothetical protein
MDLCVTLVIYQEPIWVSLTVSVECLLGLFPTVFIHLLIIGKNIQFRSS